MAKQDLREYCGNPTALNKPFIQVTEETWNQQRSRENPSDTHPCDHWHHQSCMCKGACSCHWADKAQTTHTTDPIHIGNAMLDLCENWEKVANEFRERADKSKTANGTPNPEICRGIAVALEQCARDVKKIIERIPEHTVLYPSQPPDTLRTGKTPKIPNTLPDCDHNKVAPSSYCYICGKKMPL